MKEERCNITAQIANLLMVYIVCLTVLFLGEYLLKRTPGVVPVLFLGVFLAYLFFLRSVVSNFIVYALLHIPPFVILIFIPWEMGKTELLLYAFVFTVLDFVHWIKRKKGTFAFVPIPLVLINALAYLYADVKKNTVGMILDDHILGRSDLDKNGEYSLHTFRKNDCRMKKCLSGICLKTVRLRHSRL